VCLGPVDAASEGILPCGHSFCLQCISSWAAHANNCPNCKEPFFLIEHRVDGAKWDSIPVAERRLRQDGDEDRFVAERAQEEEHALAFAEMEAAAVGGGVDPEVLADCTCSVCQRGDREDVLMLCDAC